MRQVFTSPRIENVERVARMLQDEGIEVRITNGRSYKGNRRGNFSYRDSGGPQPALWIIRSEDQPRARAMLREMGLMDSSRNAPDSFLAVSFRGADPYAATPAQKRSFRYKIGLLVVISVVLALALLHGAKTETTVVTATAPPAVAKVAPPAAVAATITPLETAIADAGDTAPPAGNPVAPTPTALAEVVFESRLRGRGMRVACLALDGKDAPAALVSRLKRTGADVVAASACTLPADPAQPSHDASGREASFLEVGSFRPEPADKGSRGTLQRSEYGNGRAPALDILEVRRSDDGWRIVGPAPPAS